MARYPPAVHYQLEEIPVWKAYEAKCRCSLCQLERESEARNTGFFLGSSIMAPQMRVELNRHGFCPRHLHMLLAGTGKLGYALALATHLADLQTRLRSLEARISAAGAAASRRTGRRVDPAAVRRYCGTLADQERDCLMCDRVSHNLLNYAFTIVTLSRTNEHFAKALDESEGFCLHHVPIVVRMAAAVLPAREQAAWFRRLFALQSRSLDRLLVELEQFTWQFDYRSELKTPPSAMDSVARAVDKLAGQAPLASAP